MPLLLSSHLLIFYYNEGAESPWKICILSSFSSLRGRGRGGRTGRGGRGSRGGRAAANGKAPENCTREELDQQLDEYMSKTKNALDTELDQYMKDAPA